MVTVHNQAIFLKCQKSPLDECMANITPDIIAPIPKAIKNSAPNNLVQL